MPWNRAAPDIRRKRLWQGAALLLCAVAVAAAGAGLLASSQPTLEGVAPHRARRDAVAIGVLLRGVPQHGVVLGSARARVRIIEFIDPRCPSCWHVAQRLLRELVGRYLRPGRVRLELWPLDWLGGQSTRAARAAFAAGEQNRLWSFLAVLYANQQAGTAGDLSDAYLRKIGRTVPGLHVERMVRDARHSRGVGDELLQARLMARHTGVQASLAVLVDTLAGGFERFELHDLTADKITRALDSALRT